MARTLLPPNTHKALLYYPWFYKILLHFSGKNSDVSLPIAEIDVRFRRLSSVSVSPYCVELRMSINWTSHIAVVPLTIFCKLFYSFPALPLVSAYPHNYFATRIIRLRPWFCRGNYSPCAVLLDIERAHIIIIV